ncbi:MAG: hypothetical protein RL336_564 [Pseudomonadota bacterium]
MTTLYGIPNCDTVKKARIWLEQHSIDFTFHDFRKDGLEASTVKAWCARIDWETLVNKRSTSWKKIDEATRNNLCRDNVAALLVAYPTLIKRPVLDNTNILAVGFNADHYQQLFAR